MSYPPRPLADRFWEKVDKAGGCWLWTAAKGSNGYGNFVAYKGEAPTGAHRMSWELTFGEIPDGGFVLHRCDNRLCVRPSHLFLGTQADNLRDMHAKGRWRYMPRDQRGERNPNSVASDAKVAMMLADIARGQSIRSVAREYGVKYHTLWAITKRSA
jgi:hypothetical protein